MTGGRPGGECAIALANRLASTRSSSPGSVRTSGSSSGTTRRTFSELSASCRASGATSSMEAGRRNGSGSRCVSLLMSSRLPIRSFSRSADSSIVASSAASSAGASCTPVWRSVLTLALMEASGVRRSWLTAASSAVRIRLPSASASAWAAWVRSRSRSRAAAAWAAKPSSSRGGDRLGLSGDDEREIGRRARDAGRGDPAGACRRTATVIHWSPTCSASSARPPLVLVRWSSIAVGVSCPAEHGLGQRQQCGRVLAAARRLRTARRAARCTTLLTVTATVTNSNRASMFCGSAMVRVCTRRGEVPVDQQAGGDRGQRRRARTRPPRR